MNLRIICCTATNIYTEKKWETFYEFFYYLFCSNNTNKIQIANILYYTILYYVCRTATNIVKNTLFAFVIDYRVDKNIIKVIDKEGGINERY